MRADVKLGVIFSAGIVLAAGGYYLWRSPSDAPIELDEAKASVPATTTDLQATRTNPASKSPARTSSRRPAKQPTTTTPNHTTEDRTQSMPDIGSRSAQHSSRNNESSRSRPASTRTTTPKQDDNSSLKGSVPSEPGGLVDASDTDTTPKRMDSVPGERTVGSSTGDTDGTNPATTDKPRSEPIRTQDTGLARRTQPSDDSSVNTRGDRAGDNSASSARTERALTSRPPAQATSPESRAAVESHIVQPGDTLAGLARRYYGSERHTDVLIKGNPQLANPALLQVGATVLIPSLPVSGNRSDSAATATNPRDTAAKSLAERTYLVRDGDSFYAIARDQLGDASRWAELYELNKSRVGDNPDSLRIGQEIVLPEK